MKANVSTFQLHKIAPDGAMIINKLTSNQAVQKMSKIMCVIEKEVLNKHSDNEMTPNS